MNFSATDKVYKANVNNRDVQLSTVDVWSMFMYVCELNRGKSNWHVEFILEHLNNIIFKKEKNLILNVPPGHGKTVVMIVFCALYLGYHPNTRLLILSGTDTVRKKYSEFLKEIIQSELYQQIFDSRVEIDKDKKCDSKMFSIKKQAFKDGSMIGGGQVYILSTMSNLTGTDADLVVVDDPIDYNTYTEQGYAYVKKINDFINGFFSRKRDVVGVKEVPFILIMQRICEGDTTEYLLEARKSANWRNIEIPAVEDSKEDVVGVMKKSGEKVFGKRYSVNNFQYLRRHDEVLCPFLKNRQLLDEEKEGYLYAGRESDYQYQFQQKSIVKSTSIFNVGNIKHYNPDDIQISDFDKIVQSWDTAYGQNNAGDPSCCTTWGVKIINHKVGRRREFIAYLIDVWFGQIDLNSEYTGLVETAIRFENIYNPDHILIENAGTGISLTQDLEREYFGQVLKKEDPRKNSKIVSIVVQHARGNSKVERARGCSYLVEKGCVVFPNDFKKVISLYKKQINPLEELKIQMKIFPTKNDRKHDDGVDSLTQFLNWAKLEFLTQKREIKIWHI